MIIADTNVWSEPLHSAPEPKVRSWMLAHETELSMTAITVGELLNGVLKLPAGRRRSTLADRIEQTILTARPFVVVYDEPAARQYAAVRRDRRAAGRPIGVEDAMIAATCLSRGAALATRNVRDFEGIGLTLINPWED